LGSIPKFSIFASLGYVLWAESFFVASLGIQWSQREAIIHLDMSYVPHVLRGAPLIPVDSAPGELIIDEKKYPTTTHKWRFGRARDFGEKAEELGDIGCISL
jgi:hypothetical protein